MKKKLLTVFGGFLGLTVVAYVFFGPSLFKSSVSNSQKDSSVKVGLANTFCKPDNLPYLIAKDKGYFKDEGIDISETYWNYQEKPEFNEENLHNNFDFLVAGRAEVYDLEGTFENKWNIFNAVYDTKEKSSYAIIVKEDFKGEGLSSLKEKKIGLVGSSGKARFVLMDLILEKNGLNPKDFTIKDANVSDLENGTIEALYLREPQLSVAMSEGKYKILFDNPVTASIMTPWPMGFSVVSSEFSNKNPEETKKIINAWQRGIDFINQNPKEAEKYQTNCLAENYQVKDKVIRQAQYWTTNDMDKATIQKQIDLYLEKGLISKKIKAEDLLY